MTGRRDHADPGGRDEVKAAPEGGARRRGWRLDASVLVALFSVAVALIYSAVQAKDSARQLQLSQRSLELTTRNSELSGLLDLHAKIVDTDKATTTALQRVRALKYDPAAISRLVQAVTPLEGIAYLMRHDRTGISGATDIWKRYLVCAFYTARAGVGGTLDGYVPELTRFATTQQRTLGPDRRCVSVLLPR